MIYNGVECRIWNKSLDGKGYGQSGTKKYKTRIVHRQTWIEVNGYPTSETPYVLHHCDNPPCYEIKHLFLGTQKDNMEDKVSKDRQSHCGFKGEINPNCKLTDIEIAEIRQKYRNGEYFQWQLGIQYGISQVHIGRIVNGQTRGDLI